MTNLAQTFCTVQDLINDAQAPIADEARLYQAIREACDYLQKEIGWFVPVTLTQNYQAVEEAYELFVPPLLSVSAITDEGVSLSAADYILKPNNGHWNNGPYTKLVADPDSVLLGCWSDEIDGVAITGTWGLFDRTASTAATVADTTQQDASQTTLKVSSGAKVSPGMVLLIGSEQELVTGWSDPTASITTVNGAISASDEVITLTNASLVNVGEIIRIDFEQMLVKDRKTSTQQILVMRGYNGTGRVSHLTSTAVDVYRTVNVERGVNGTTAAVHANGASISRYLAPDDVQLLAKKMATLIVNQAKSGYQGRTGNTELGVVFYHDIFVRDIETIKKSYHLPRVA